MSLDYMPKNRDGLLFSERIADETTDIWDIVCDRLDAYPNLRAMYDENDDNTQVLYFNGGLATFSAFGQPDEVVEF